MGERGGIQNRGLSTAKYEGFKIADEEKKVGKVLWAPIRSRELSLVMQ